MLHIEEASNSIKQIITIVQGISAKDRFYIKKGLGFYKIKPQGSKLIRTEDSFYRMLLSCPTVLTPIPAFSKLPQASRPDIEFFIDHLLPIWEKFAKGEIFPLLQYLFNFYRTPQFLSIETELYLLLKEAPDKKDSQEELEFIKVYLKNCLENGMMTEMMSECVI